VAKIGSVLSMAENEYSSGKFAAALRRMRTLTNPSPEEEIFLSECLEMCGFWDESKRRALRLAEDHNSPQIRGRAKTVLGTVCSINSDLDAAEKHFADARKLLKEVGAHERACESGIRQLTALLNMRTGSFLDGLASQLQSETVRLDNQRLSSMFHVAATNLHASAGRTALARTHAILAHSLLRSEQNYWLEASLALAESGIAFLEGDLDAALTKAVQANKWAEDSGQLWSRVASVTTCAFLLIRSGKDTKAESWIKGAEQLSSAIPVLRIANLENLAQIALLRGDCDAARRVLTVLESAETLRIVQGSWYELPIAHTRIRLHRCLGNWSEAEQLSTAAIAIAESRSDQNSIALLSACRAEALASLRRTQEALSAMQTSLGLLTHASTPAKAEIDRGLAVLFGRFGESSSAEQCLEHATKLADHTKDAVLAAEIAEACRILRESSVQESTPTVHSWVLQFWHLITSQADPEILASLLSTRHYRDAFEVAEVRAPGKSVIADQSLNRQLLVADRRESLKASGDVLELIPRNPDICVLTSALVKASLENLRFLSRRDRSAVSASTREPGSGDARKGDILFGPSMLQLLETANRIAATSITVLITGETGTGKEVLARFIHKASDRKTRQFVPVNCSALSRELLESTLFGHRRGAFTGASESFDGLVKGAEGGTLFLDEVGDLPLDLQPKFLRFLETGEVLPLGTNQPLKVNVRVLAATNANLADLVASGRFRTDLYYRLNGIHFQLPPLRSRRTEIPALARHLLDRYADEFGKGELTLSPEVMEHLLIYDWPGNVRQLASELRRLAALAEPNAAVPPALLSEAILAGPPRHQPPREGEPTVSVPIDQSLDRAVELVERTMIARALERSRGRVHDAARLLGISRKGLFLKRRRYGITARES
jgi:DNA-binding NtrC family response regulator